MVTIRLFVEPTYLEVDSNMHFRKFAILNFAQEQDLAYTSKKKIQFCRNKMCF